MSITTDATAWRSPVPITGRLGTDRAAPQSELPDPSWTGVLAELRYAGVDGTSHVHPLHAFDHEHAGGHRIGPGIGAFVAAVRAARLESAMDEDFAQLGTSAVLQGSDGAYYIVPLSVHDGDGSPMGSPSIDRPSGPSHSVWDGEDRPGVWYPTQSLGSIDGPGMGRTRIELTSRHDALVAVVGVDRWVDMRA